MRDRRRPAVRGERIADDVQRRLDAELDSVEGAAAQRWRVRDVRAATGDAAAGDFVRVFGTAKIHVTPPGADALGRCLLAKLSASSGTLTLLAVEGCSIDGGTSASTSTGWGTVQLVAVSATEWETA